MRGKKLSPTIGSLSRWRYECDRVGAMQPGEGFDQGNCRVGFASAWRSTEDSEASRQGKCKGAALVLGNVGDGGRVGPECFAAGGRCCC